MAAKAPQRRMKKKTKNPHLSPSFSSLPDEIILNCLARASRSDYRSLSFVSKSIRSSLSSPELYTTRSLIGNTEPCLYLCQELPNYDRWYTLDQTLITKGWIKDELSLSPIRPSSSSAPLKSSTTVAVGFEIYQIGGTINNDDERPSSAVRVLDCRTRTWRDAPDMTVARKGAEAALIDGQIFVVGGTEESMNWAEVFDLKTQTWKPLLPSPGAEGAKAVLYRGKVLVSVRSELKRYAYDSQAGRWKEFPDFGFLDVGPSFFSKLPERVAWCVIENVTFSVLFAKFLWYDSERVEWFKVGGLEDLYAKNVICFDTVRLANYAEKLVILWEEKRLLKFPVAGTVRCKYRCKNKRVWCAVIRLEKRIGSSGLEIRGEIERLNAVLTVPESYQVLCCITL